MPSLNTGNAILSNAITVGSTYNVGIGISSPNCKLEVLPTTNNKIQFGTGVVGSSGEYVGGLYYTSNKLSLQSFLVGTGYQPVLLAPDGGNVGIGTTSPDNLLVVSGSTGSMKLEATTTNRSAVQIYNTQNTMYLGIDNASASYFGYVAHSANIQTLNYPIIFSNGSGAPLERMRISSNGYSHLGFNTAAYTALTYHTLDNNLGGSEVVDLIHTSSSAPYGLYIGYPNANPNSNGYWFQRFDSSTGPKFYVYSNGNVQNTNNSYGQISDIRLKENIVDATPKLDKLMQVRIVNYNLIGDELKQLGVIAQELEQIFPGLVDEQIDTDREGNDLGTTTKSVKMSIFVPMLIKAMQEQQAMIEAQQQQINSLINR